MQYRQLFLFLTLAIFASCSTQTWKNSIFQSKISRTTASNNIVDITALNRLKLLKKHSQELVNSIKKQGNPRFYLLENFLHRTDKIINELVQTQNSALSEEVFVPNNREVALKFVELVAAYEIMSSAGIYLSFNQLLPEEDKITSRNFVEYDRAMSHYLEAIKIMSFAGITIKIEDSEMAKALEVKALLSYLVTRIEYFYEDFITKRRDRKIIKRLIRKVRALKATSPQVLSMSLKILMKKKLWKTVQLKLDNLTLPESSSIGGSDEAFEKVMSVQVGATLLNEVSTMFLNRE
jgi:hypothetical protein